MCDTFVVMPDVSALRHTVLCKNSDRPSFDCQPLAMHAAKKYAAGETIRLSYVTIDQVPERYASAGSSPFWCWGYEEGINEFGVAIGNEAVYTKDLAESREAEKSENPCPKGILGMELLRLGLERGKTAEQALRVMTALVEEYGQWGSGVPMSDTAAGSYNNSYIIADPAEAWILETAGKRWAARRLERGSAAISNELTIRTEITRCSEDLKSHAVEEGWIKADSLLPFDFGRAYIATDTPRQVSHIRLQRIRSLLAESVSEHGNISVEDMKGILRDHYENTFLNGPCFNASDPDFLTVCMHQSTADFTWGNTASSAIMMLPQTEDKLPLMWWAAGVPCCSVYIPVFVHAGELPDSLMKAGTAGKKMCAPSDVPEQDHYREDSFWWQMRSLLDLVNGDACGTDYSARHGIVREAFDAMEKKWLDETDAVQSEALRRKAEEGEAAMRKYLAAYTESCVSQASEMIQKLKTLW